MKTSFSSIHADMIPQLISRFRDGQPVVLVCHRGFEDFTPASVYPVHKISSGSALDVQDDTGDVIALDASFPALGNFLLADSQEEADLLSKQMKVGFTSGLAMRAKQYIEARSYAVGDVIQWRPGMRLQNAPLDGQPAIVVEVLSQPVTDETAHLLDPVRTLRCDLVIAFDGPGATMITSLADSRRFDLYPYQAKILDGANQQD